MHSYSIFNSRLHLQPNNKINQHTMDYLSSHTIYNEIIDGMRAMGINKEEQAQNL